MLAETFLHKLLTCPPELIPADADRLLAYDLYTKAAKLAGYRINSEAPLVDEFDRLWKHIEYLGTVGYNTW